MDNSPSRTILFVCTGNTCRSPMAEAIATSAIAKARATPAPRGTPGPRVALRAFSAGVDADEGAAMTQEAVESLRRIEVLAPLHRAVRLNRDMIAKADFIFAMGPSHVQRVLELEPDARSKVQALDPSGRAIPDPLGAEQGVYDETARELRRLIDLRLKEILR